MSSESPCLVQEPIARRPKSPRPTSRREAAAADKPRKVSFYLSADIVKRLGVAASMEESDKSRVVEKLLRDGLKNWVVQYRGRGEESLAQPSEITSAV